MPNHYTGRNWDEVPWEKLGRGKRRERLLKESNYACTECGYNKRRPDGGVILEIDHIDGDPGNDAKENHRVLCPNCHALTPTFRNWGSPRTRQDITSVAEREQGFRIQEVICTSHTRGV